MAYQENPSRKTALDKYQFLRSSARFQRMRNRGAIPPPLALISSVSELVKREFLDIVTECEQEATILANQSGTRLGVSDADPYEETARHLVKALRERLKKALKEDNPSPQVIAQMERQLRRAQEDFFEEFSEDADDETKARVFTALTRDGVFTGRLNQLRAGYIRSAVERIGQGKSDLRKKFIALFSDWIEGKSNSLDSFKDIMAKCTEEAGTFSRFFARDQFSRFGRTLTVASYDAAGAKWVKWITVNDARVRKTHRALNGKIFAIDDLPEEYLDYQCRCSYLPVYILGNRTVTKGDGIALAA